MQMLRHSDFPFQDLLLLSKFVLPWERFAKKQGFTVKRFVCVGGVVYDPARSFGVLRRTSRKLIRDHMFSGYLSFRTIFGLDSGSLATTIVSMCQ